MENKKITIIIIGSNNIENCLRSVFDQSYINDMEILLLYNEELNTNINELKLKYPNCKFLVVENNMFETIEQNKKLINGKFISLLNSEDSVTIDFYRTMVKRAEKENADIVMSNSILKYSDGGQAYLNLSEASLTECENEKILEEYEKQKDFSFLWNIYGNKIFSKEIFDEILNEILKENLTITSSDFCKLVFKHGKKLRKIENEVLLYNFEKSEEYIKDKNKFENSIITKVKTAWNDNLEKLKKEIISDKTEIVSFDIFDTLIMRPFWNPIDMFTFLNKYFRKITGIETGIDFSKIRIEAEKNVRNKLCNTTDKQDITLNEIYQEIKEEVGLDNEILEKLKFKEQELEIEFCSERKTAKEIFELAQYLNKKIICISDMYLPKETIEKILNKNGYFIENVYLSSNIKLTKFTGDLYKYVIDELKIDGSKIVHIGDNYYSDYENAKKYEINAQFLPKAVDVFCNENITNSLGAIFKKNIPMWQNTANGLNFLGIRCMLALVANKYFDNPYRTFNNKSDFNADPNLIGYYALGMHLYGIADWLLKDTIKEKYDKIVFFARDGYWTMKAYQILKQNYDNSPKEEYLYISRRALIPVTLNNKFDFYKLSELIDIYKYTPKTILKFIKNIIYNEENLEKECANIGIETNKKFENKEQFILYINLILEKFYDRNKHEIIISKLKKYFSNVFSGNTCAFDIGYSAKPEMYLSKLCKKPIDTYFVNISNEEAYEHTKIGNFKLHTYFDYTPAITGVIREGLMSTSDASCIGYDFDEDENVIQVFESKKNNYAERFVFDAMQNKAMEFITDIVEKFGKNIEELYYQKYYISLPHEMYINSPKEIDQEIFNGTIFEDTIGIGEKITAIQEWNKEIEKKKQKRTTELFDIKITERLKEKIEKIKKEKEITEKKCKDLEKEIDDIYNSKRWKAFEKANKILGRKNNFK